MSSQDYEEKLNEKQEEKGEEKEREKTEEKWNRDPVSGVVGAFLLIWAGVVLLASNMGFLNTFTDLLDNLGITTWRVPWEMPFVSARALPVFFLGAGVILLVEIVVRLVMPAYRRQVLGTIIGAMVFFALALGQWDIIWPLILIAVGASIAVRALTSRQ